MYTTELDNMASCCIKALEGSNYDVRVCVAELLGSLLAASQKPVAGKAKKDSLEEVFSIMSAAFLRGGVGFLKGGGGELLKSGISQDVRVGVTQVCFTVFPLIIYICVNVWSMRNAFFRMMHMFLFDKTVFEVLCKGCLCDVCGCSVSGLCGAISGTGHCLASEVPGCRYHPRTGACCQPESNSLSH